jgi:hypothetical protein
MSRAGPLLVLVAAIALAVSSCDPRVFFAQSPLFEGMRGDLIEECCACLARRGTKAPGASCAEAVIGPDGGIVLPEDAEVIADNGSFTADDNDDIVDEDGDGKLERGEEIPCACGVDEASCIGLLESGERVPVVGACIEQPNNFWDAPCESACSGVLTFDSISTAQ